MAGSTTAGTAPASIERLNRERQVTLLANIPAGGSQSVALDAIDEAMGTEQPGLDPSDHVIFTIDDDVAVIGSSNMDMRSFGLNMEISMLVRGEEFVRQMRGVEDVYFYLTAASVRADGLPGRAHLTCQIPSETGSTVIKSSLLQQLAADTPGLELAKRLPELALPRLVLGREELEGEGLLTRVDQVPDGLGTAGHARGKSESHGRKSRWVAAFGLGLSKVGSRA